MQTEHLQRAFKEIGVPFKFEKLQRPYSARPSDIDNRILVNTSGTKYAPFILQFGEDATGEVNVLNVNPDEKGVLLQIKFDDTKTNFLCGLDEFNKTFIARVPNAGITSVFSAKESLKPPEVRIAERYAPKMSKQKNKHKRKNSAWLRQGEWFFIPAPNYEPDKNDIVRNNAPLIRGRSRAHKAQFAIDHAWATHYVHRTQNNIISQEAFNHVVKEDPKESAVWEVRSESSSIYVKGKITAPDHKTLDLKIWHRAIPNQELGLTTGRITTTFYD